MTQPRPAEPTSPPLTTTAATTPGDGDQDIGAPPARVSGEDLSPLMHRPSSYAEPSSGRSEQPDDHATDDHHLPATNINLDHVHGQDPIQSAPPGRHAAQQTPPGSPPGDARPASLRRSPSASDAAASMLRRRPSLARAGYEVPAAYANLGELAVSPVQNPDETPLYRHVSLEQVRSSQPALVAEEQRRRASLPASSETAVSRLATQLYTVSYLILFSILGTLARLGLQALATYPGAPLSTGVAWANFAGSLVMGFLAEDRTLFPPEPDAPVLDAEAAKAARDEESGSSGANNGHAAADPAAAKAAHAAAKKTIPLYIGLATGFCGSFTSFSSFIRDAFLAMSNDLPAADESVVPRNGGDSFMALLAVILTTVSLSLSALFAGAHLAIALEPVTPSLPQAFMRRILDRLVVVLGWGAWLGAVILSITPPDNAWRGKATFALVFAPLGCLARFYVSTHLNGWMPSFPLGTFAVNVAGTVVLGLAWDLAHVPLGGVIGCQVLQGVEDGFCGCLTTVSTWVAELAALRRRHAYVYGGLSVLVSLAFMVAIMGGLRWSTGFDILLCSH